MTSIQVNEWDPQGQEVLLATFDGNFDNLHVDDLFTKNFMPFHVHDLTLLVPSVGPIIYISSLIFLQVWFPKLNPEVTTITTTTTIANFVMQVC